MLEWFKAHWTPPRPSKDEANADRVLGLLVTAIKEVHPDRFIDPLDAALWTQPRLAEWNQILGLGSKKDHSERFSAVEFHELVEGVSSLEQKGLIGKIGALVVDDVVLLALVLAAMHERHNSTKRDEVRRQAEFLLVCLGGKS
jgi:hypothetical protein